MSNNSMVYVTAALVNKLGAAFFKLRNERIENERNDLHLKYFSEALPRWSWKTFKYIPVTSEQALEEVKKTEKWCDISETGLYWATRIRDLMDCTEVMEEYGVLLVDAEVFAILAKYERHAT